jgi:short-subunit dehydrogenase
MDFAERYGPWALVAGASEGLGAAFADGCASRGCNVVLVARRAALLDETAAGIRARHGVETRVLAADLGRADVAELIAGVTDDIEVGLLVYNAAAAPMGPFVDRDIDEHIVNIAVNITTPTVLTHMLARPMVERGHGGVVLVSSAGALQGMKVFVSYAAAKSYEMILAEGLWDELREHGVDAIAYVVGATATPHFQGSTDNEVVQATGAITPEQCAARLFDVLGTGPRAFSNPRDEDSAIANAARPRAELVEAIGRVTGPLWG